MARSPGTGLRRTKPIISQTDFDQLYGVAIGPGDMIVFAELGTGRVHALRSGNVETLASGLHDPVGVAFDPDGAPLVAESGAGRVVTADRRRAPRPWWTACSSRRASSCADGQLYIVDAGAKEVIAFDLNSKARTHDRLRPAGRTSARGGTQATQGNAAVLRTAGAVRRHRRGTRWHAVRFGRRRRQRAGAAPSC